MFRRLVLSLAVSLLAVSPSAAQQGGPLQPPTTGGLSALLQELRMLGHQKRVLMIGAHPDDEDTELLVLLTRREGAEAAYLSLTRGEGGQNLIGNELGEALGILRTEELLAARNVDGAQQFFTRGYDFGYSKTIEDTWAHWPSDSVLKDVVRIVRRFRPQVIVSVFSGTPRDGHGQHQAAGWAARAAFRAAGDPARFPELRTEEGLEPWAATKLYRSARFDTAATTLVVEGGEVEKLSGKTYHQLAMAARSLHRSQDFGVLQEFGPSPVRLGLVVPAGTDVGAGWAGFWSGVDTVLKAPTEHFAALAAARAAAGRDPAAVRDALLRASESAPNLDNSTPLSVWADYQRHLWRARQAVSWVYVDAVAARPTVAVNDSIRIDLSARNAGSADLPGLQWTVVPTHLVGHFGIDQPFTLRAGETARRTYVAVVLADLAPTNPYYLWIPRVGDMYVWPARIASREWWGTAKDPDEFIGGLVPSLGTALLGGGFPIVGTVSARYRNQAYGEIRRPVVIVPRVSVKIAPSVAVVRTMAQGSARIITFDVMAEHGATDTTRGTMHLELPAGWPRPSPVPFILQGTGAVARARFEVTAPSNAPTGQFEVKAFATDANGTRYDFGAFAVDYPHIRSRQYTRPAVARLEVLDLVAPSARRIAYIRGAADRVPEALSAAGLNVTVLDSTQIVSADLSIYDAVVVGSRAYEVDSALVRNNGRLLDYARNGGRLIVQYQQGIFIEGGFAPFPVTQGSPADRITNENAPVVMLGARPERSALAPIFRTPNAIGPDDWNGWVQDRALYCLRSWDDRYASLLSMNDPGETPIGGCLLEAPLGRGSYVYTGLAFFRQLPAGVPGAYRLFFNLLGGRVTP